VAKFSKSGVFSNVPQGSTCTLVFVVFGGTRISLTQFRIEAPMPKLGLSV